MPITLKERLKAAKRKSEFNSLKNLIISETKIQDKDILNSNLTYHDFIDFVHEKLALKKDQFDIESEKYSFKNFLMGISEKEKINIFIESEGNIFFITLPGPCVVNHPDFFWDGDKLMRHTNDRIFTNQDLSKGCVVLMSEYGIEKAVW